MRYAPRKAMVLFVRPLTTSELPNYLEHLLRFDSAYGRMRFGFPISDTGIRAHVQRIDLRTSHILALFDDDLDVVAAAHIGRAADDVAEFAFSVDREWRDCGVGSELFDLVVLWARNRRIRHAIVYCLNENQPMAHRLRSQGTGARAGERQRGAARSRGRACRQQIAPTPIHRAGPGSRVLLQRRR
jgi:GNAT superfamily N-acetyltransferase